MRHDRFAVMPTSLRELYRDPHLLVVEKPFGLASQPTRKQGKNLYDLLCETEDYVGLHHRLATPASGLILVALDRSINTQLASDFQARRIERRYQAVVVGQPPESGSLSQPLDGKPARTHYTRLATHNALSVLELRLETGRTHQIRRHTAEAGFPIVGDRRYGGSSGRLWNRLALHATSLRFIHPVFKEPLHLHSQIPADLEGLFQPIQEAP